MAARNNEPSKVQMLLGCPDIDINGYEDGIHCTALLAASSRGHVEVVKELLKNVNIDANMVSTGCDNPLGKASVEGNLEVIKELLWDARVDPNLKNRLGNTPLIMAVKAKQIEATKLLLRCPRTDTTLKNNDDKTALDEASGDNRLAIQSRPLLLAEGHTCTNEQGEQ